jgi:hypothetical protein
MRRVILWIVAILITFAIGTGADSFRRYLFTKETPAAEKVEAAPLEVAAPVFAPIVPFPESAAPAPNLILDYNPEKLDHYGALYIMGPAPEGFRDFECIALGLSGARADEDFDYITVYGDKSTGEWTPANFALVTERYLYFTTEPSKEQGFQYRFEGEFLVKNFAAAEGKNKGVVRGTLTKSKNGHTIAEQTVTFRMEYMGC